MEASDRYGSLVYKYRGMDYLRLAVFWSGDRLIDWENGSCGFEAVYSIDILAGRGHRRHPVKCGDLCGAAGRLARRQLIKGMDCFKLSMPFFFSFSGHATGGV